jgi:hypothetical protein
MAYRLLGEGKGWNIYGIEERDRQIAARLADICARRSDCIGNVDYQGVTDDVVALLAELRGAS